MRIRFLNRVNILISALLASLGFSSCGKGGSEVIDKYGCPEVMYGGPYEVFEEIEVATEEQTETEPSGIDGYQKGASIADTQETTDNK